MRESGSRAESSPPTPPPAAAVRGGLRRHTVRLQALDEYLTTIIDSGASDLHLSSQHVPTMRLHGELAPISERQLSAQEVADHIKDLLYEEDWERLPTCKNIDFAYETSIHGKPRRFRCNVYTQELGLSIVMRVVPSKVPTIEECGLPPSVKRMTKKVHGLVLVTGPAGSGKSTTLAALINHINAEKRLHIITIEDPIEYVHECQTALINQRQVGMDVDTFQNALRGALREDPDVILIGELRDLETMQLAVTAAETGHLVFATLHTNNAAKSIDRLIDVFPADQQAQIRIMVAETLKGIIAQQLCPRMDGGGRVLAAEILHATPAVSNLIRESRSFQIPAVMETQKAMGMCTMDEALAHLWRRGIISELEARGRAIDPAGLVHRRERVEDRP